MSEFSEEIEASLGLTSLTYQASKEIHMKTRAYNSIMNQVRREYEAFWASYKGEKDMGSGGLCTFLVAQRLDISYEAASALIFDLESDHP